MTNPARRLIAENKKTRATSLDLGNCGLTEIPREIAELVWLKSLTLASVWHEWDGKNWREKKSQNFGPTNYRLTTISPLGSLGSLRSLIIANTQVDDLAPLSGLTSLQKLDVMGTQIADLKPLAALPSLQVLEASHTKISTLAPLAHLSNLQILDLRSTKIDDLKPLANLTCLKVLNLRSTKVFDVAPLTNLSNLQILNISYTQVEKLTPLIGMTTLQRLYLSHTRVKNLAPLTNLLSLQTLDISNSAVFDLAPLLQLINKGFPVLSKSKVWGSYGVNVKGCPLVNPPVAIANHGNKAILNYFKERDLDEVDHLYEAKVLILGEGGSGKTSLLRRLYQPDKALPTEQETTRGIDIHRCDFLLKNGRHFRLNVWDFGGQEIYHATHQFFLTQRSLYLLLDDTRKDHKSVSDEGFKYWLELIDLFGDHSPILIFQNEKGGRSKAIDLTGIKVKYDNVVGLYTGNLANSRAADKLRDGIEFYASHLSHIGEELPARWVRVREDIEYRANNVAHITQQEYFDIYCRHLAFDRTKALHLSRYLHDLGVFLHFQDDPLLRRTVILQNQWATEAVFRILDNETVKTQLGRFNSTDCERLWKDSAYADMHPELLALMQRFELCYLLADTRPQTWLAPQLLPPAKPDVLLGWHKPDDLVLRYGYDFMPKGLISRLMVRLHRFVRNPEMAWVSGVLFEYGNTEALVELLASGSEIELRVRGPERKALLSVISSDLDALNESFEGLRGKVDKRIPCNCKICRSSHAPEFFAQKNLLKRKEDSRLKVECPRSYEDVGVLDLLDGIRLDNLPGWARSGKDSGNGASAPHVIRIFLASSSELREDRDAFDLYFRQQNDLLLKKGLYLKIVRWENFLDAMSETRLQDEYNRAIQDCDIFVSLFFSKTGKFSEEEFDKAHHQFKETGRPLLYTYFKNANLKTGSLLAEDLISMLTFKDKLAKLGHFHTAYDDVTHLKLQFRDQLDKINPLLQPSSYLQND